MPEYTIRYPDNDRKQSAYENACDCILSGIGIAAWYSCGLDKTQRTIVWGRACRDVGQLEMI